MKYWWLNVLAFGVFCWGVYVADVITTLDGGEAVAHAGFIAFTCLVLGFMASIAVLLFKRDVEDDEWRAKDFLRRLEEEDKLKRIIKE
jgi:hypothetical protein